MNGKPLVAAILGTSSLLLAAAHSEQLIQANLEYLAQHADSDKLFATANAQEDDDDFWPSSPDDWRAYFRPYVVKDGVLQIPVQGVLLHKFPYNFGRWATGYQYIERAMARGMEDGNVKAIALVFDTPGGMVAGCFECADKIAGYRGQKPIRAFVSDSAYSAGYMLASAADPGSITVTRSGGVGSIGVVAAHFSYKGALDRIGLEVTFIFAGKHKVDGNAYEKLSATAKARMQKRVDKMYGEFVSSVARNRDMDEEDIRATEALTYDAEEGIEIGLADKIGALEEELALYASELAETGDEDMAVQPNVTGKKPGSADENATFAQSDIDAAHAEGVAEGTKQGATDERARISGILALEEAAVRPKAAMNVAMKTAMSVEDAKAFLKDMPEEKAAAPQGGGEGDDKAQGRNHFEEHMNGGQNPNIKPLAANQGGEGQDGKNKDETALAQIFADSDMATGRKAKAAS